MYNAYLGQQQQQQQGGQQAYQPAYQNPQATGYLQQPPQQQPFQPQQQQQYLTGQPTGYLGAGGGFQSPSPQPGQYGAPPPVPAIPNQYLGQTASLTMPPTGYMQPQQQQFSGMQQPQQMSQPSTPAVSTTTTGHQRKT